MSIDARSLFALLSDETRLRSIVLLERSGELCVCELVHALDTVQPKVSRHLAALREAGVVDDRRAGQWVYYSISGSLPDWAKTILRGTTDSAAGQPGYREDFQRLSRMPARPERRACP